MESQAVRLLLKQAEDLEMKGVTDFSVLTVLDQEGFQNLKVLSLYDCPNTEYLANGTSEIQHELFPRTHTLHLQDMPKLKALCLNDQLLESFMTNLISLTLRNCDVLKYAFSLSVARNLIRLETLVIKACNQMEEIVSKQGREHEKAADTISFKKLTNLTLKRLNSLVGFFQANKLYSSQEVSLNSLHICANLKLFLNA